MLKPATLSLEFIKLFNYLQLEPKAVLCNPMPDTNEGAKSFLEQHYAYQEYGINDKQAQLIVTAKNNSEKEEVFAFSTGENMDKTWDDMSAISNPNVDLSVVEIEAGLIKTISHPSNKLYLIGLTEIHSTVVENKENMVSWASTKKGKGYGEGKGLFPLTEPREQNGLVHSRITDSYILGNQISLVFKIQPKSKMMIVLHVTKEVTIQ